MKKKTPVVGILGDGRIAQAIRYFCIHTDSSSCAVTAVQRDTDAQNCDVLVAALPGELGERGLRLALKYGKNLIDISDIDPPFYIAHQKKIERRGITVIPGCGFSPGLVNGILGHELSIFRQARHVEIKAGSLSRKKHFYPFLWCFEDLVLEHNIPSWQLVKGRKKKYAAFAGYQQEAFFGIDAESYYCASGFENILDVFKLQSIVTRVVRPAGFREFFLFLKNYGFFTKERLLSSKTQLESAREDNVTFAEITFSGPKKRVVWLVKSTAKKSDELNSMQKITASVPAVMARFLLEGKICARGLFFMEDLSRSSDILTELIPAVRRLGVVAGRSEVSLR
jgi:lysine 6-dehydrogenase